MLYTFLYKFQSHIYARDNETIFYSLCILSVSWNVYDMIINTFLWKKIYGSHTWRRMAIEDDSLSARMRHGIKRVVTRKSVLFIYNIYKGVSVNQVAI